MLYSLFTNFRVQIYMENVGVITWLRCLSAGVVMKQRKPIDFTSIFRFPLNKRINVYGDSKQYNDHFKEKVFFV